MALNRRKFIGQSLAFGAFLPPAPPGMDTLRSPKDSEYVQSIKKVSVQSFVPKIASRAILPSALQLTGISVSGNQVTLSWVNGTGPFMIEQSDLNGEWGPVGNLTMARVQTITSPAPQAYFRIHDKVQFPLIGEDQSDGIHLSWTPPTF